MCKYRRFKNTHLIRFWWKQNEFSEVTPAQIKHEFDGGPNNTLFRNLIFPSYVCTRFINVFSWRQEQNGFSSSLWCKNIKNTNINNSVQKHCNRRVIVASQINECEWKKLVSLQFIGSVVRFMIGVKCQSWVWNYFETVWFIGMPCSRSECCVVSGSKRETLPSDPRSKYSKTEWNSKPLLQRKAHFKMMFFFLLSSKQLYLSPEFFICYFHMTEMEGRQ